MSETTSRNKLVSLFQKPTTGAPSQGMVNHSTSTNLAPQGDHQNSANKGSTYSGVYQQPGLQPKNAFMQGQPPVKGPEHDGHASGKVSIPDNSSQKIMEDENLAKLADCVQCHSVYDEDKGTLNDVNHSI